MISLPFVIRHIFGSCSAIERHKRAGITPSPGTASGSITPSSSGKPRSAPSDGPARPSTGVRATLRQMISRRWLSIRGSSTASSGPCTVPAAPVWLGPDRPVGRPLAFWGGPRDGELVEDDVHHAYGLFYKGGVYRPRLATGLFVWRQHTPPATSWSAWSEGDA